MQFLQFLECGIASGAHSLELFCEFRACLGAQLLALGSQLVELSIPFIGALGVGIGVDYALYLLSVQLAQQRAGLPLKQAYKRAVQFTGKVVALVGVTLAAGVITWAFSPIKFQADIGILLTFMFLWNMIGALVLIPALSHFLLPDRRRGHAKSDDTAMVAAGLASSSRG
jgi:predicted RND superfamily exporter protein